MSNFLNISSLDHTWLLDLDGTILKHNGYLIDGHDTLLPDANSFLASIPPNDTIIFLTSRKLEYKLQTEQFLKDNNIRYNYIIFEVPYGERILVNDLKPSGLTMSVAINVTRDKPSFPMIAIDKNL